jgi:hypothetical protein
MNEGGWIELQDIGELASDDHDISRTGLSQWYQTVVKAFEVISRGVKEAENHAERLTTAGFEEVHNEIYKWPINPWPKDPKLKQLGLWSRENMLDCLGNCAFYQIPGMDARGGTSVASKSKR